MSGYGGGAQRRGGGGNGGGGRGGGPPMVPQKGQGGPVEELKTMLLERRREYEQLFPRGFNVNSLIVSAVVALRKLQLDNPNGNFDLRSIAEAVSWAAVLGLSVGNDETYLVPYKGVVQLIVGPRGMINCAYRHPMVASINAHAVAKGDVFNYDLGSSAFVTHQRGRQSSLWSPTGDDVEAAYAVVKTTRGGEIIEVFEKVDLDSRKNLSASRNSAGGPWNNHYRGMAVKTVIKEALKRAPRATAAQLAMMEDEDGAFVPPEREVWTEIGQDLQAEQSAAENGQQGGPRQTQRAAPPPPTPPRAQEEPPPDEEPAPPPDGAPQQGAFGEWATKGQGQR